MQTAAEILYGVVKSLIAKDGDGDEYYITFKEFLENATKADVGRGFFSASLKAINEARKEAIEECANLSSLKFGDARAVGIKNQILSLINELK